MTDPDTALAEHTWPETILVAWVARTSSGSAGVTVAQLRSSL